MYFQKNLWILIVCLNSWFHSIGQEAVKIKVDPQVEFQKIEGFGASINGWNDKISSIYNDRDYLNFVVNELGLSIFRMQIWPNVSVEPIEKVEDIRYEDFKWSGPGERGKINIDFAKNIREINPEIKIIGSIWSPPPWMKDNKSFDGTKAGFLLDSDRTYDDDNRLSDHMYVHYAKWLYEWVAYMKIEDIPLYALGPQNELMFTEPYGSCMYTPDEFARLVYNIGKRFEKENEQRPIIYGPEDMTMATYKENDRSSRHTPYIDALLEPEIAQYFDVFATHGYTDGVQAGGKLDPKRYWNSIKQFNRPYWITEGGTGGHEWPIPIENGIASYIHHALVDGNVGAFVCWQISDLNRNTHGVMDMTTPTKKTFAAMHYWKFIRPGFVRVQAGSNVEEVRVSAFKNPAKNQAVIVLINNDSQPREIDIKVNEKNLSQYLSYTTSKSKNFEEGTVIKVINGACKVELEGNSIITLVENN